METKTIDKEEKIAISEISNKECEVWIRGHDKYLCKILLIFGVYLLYKIMMLVFLHYKLNSCGPISIFFFS